MKLCRILMETVEMLKRHRKEKKELMKLDIVYYLKFWINQLGPDVSFNDFLLF